MVSVSFSHKSGLIFLSLRSPYGAGKCNENWQVSFKSAECKAAILFASSRRRQTEQLFSLGLNVESFLQMHATRLLDFKQKFMAYVTWEVGEMSQASFFILNETALWQVTRQGHSGWCEKGGTTAQAFMWGAETLGGGDPVIWQKGQQQPSTVTSPAPCFYTESVKNERTAQPQEPWQVLLMDSMLKDKFNVQ